MISVGVTSTCQPSWPSFFCQFLSVLPLLHFTLPEWQAISNRQIVLLIMVHPLGILTHCIFLNGWERKQQEHDHTMLVCTSLPLAYLSLSTSLLLIGAVPRVKILNHFFSGSCQGYFQWYVKDSGPLAILGRQESGGSCWGCEASRLGAYEEARDSEVVHLAPLWAPL